MNEISISIKIGQFLIDFSIVTRNSFLYHPIHREILSKIDLLTNNIFEGLIFIESSIHEYHIFDIICSFIPTDWVFEKLKHGNFLISSKEHQIIYKLILIQSAHFEFDLKYLIEYGDTFIIRSQTAFALTKYMSFCDRSSLEMLIKEGIIEFLFDFLESENEDLICGVLNSFRYLTFNQNAVEKFRNEIETFERILNEEESEICQVYCLIFLLTLQNE
jgi:hypothetical protein